MEGARMPKFTPIAVDTNVLLDLAQDDEVVLDCLATVAKRISNSGIIVLPTVILELRNIVKSGSAAETRFATKALCSILDPWRFVPVNCVPAGHGIVEQIARKIRARGLIPEEEMHDSFIVAEAALYGVTILVSNDGHIKNIDQQMLKIELDTCDVDCPLIASPWKIAHRFFQ
jgi:predicted nucleic acid-binding protein